MSMTKGICPSLSVYDNYTFGMTVLMELYLVLIKVLYLVSPTARVMQCSSING